MANMSELDHEWERGATKGGSPYLQCSRCRKRWYVDQMKPPTCKPKRSKP